VPTQNIYFNPILNLLNSLSGKLNLYASYLENSIKITGGSMPYKEATVKILTKVIHRNSLHKNSQAKNSDFCIINKSH
jgi:hypothetical protein